MRSFYIVERKAKSGSNIPVGLSKHGKVCYARNWKEGVWFVRFGDAVNFMAAAEDANLPVYDDMEDHYLVVEHQED